MCSLAWQDVQGLYPPPHVGPILSKFQLSSLKGRPNRGFAHPSYPLHQYISESDYLTRGT